MANPILTKDRTLIALNLMPGDFDTCSDLTISREITKFRRAANLPQESVSGRLTYEDATLTRVWDNARDAAIVAQWKQNPNAYDVATLTLTALGTDGVPMGSPDTYKGIITSVARTGSDANSADRVELTVIVTIDSGA
jgi:hypothetical protein